ncbi:MAG: hypothetical protein ACXWT0_10530 [Methylobacter sp.]
MKIKKIIHEIPDAISINESGLTNLHFLKIFSLPIWLVIISISLSFVSKSVRAETEDIQQYARYVPYEGPTSTVGTAGQSPKQSSGANEAEAEKTRTGEQAASTGGKAENASQAKETAGTRSEESKGPSATTESGGQAPASGSQAAPTSPQPPLAKEPKAEGATPAEQKSSTEQKIGPVEKPEKDTGEFPSGDIPAFTQVDVNGDHYVTKDELKNFPDLLRVFDKVDAGKDGKLEQHEFQNLEMETKREGEIS